MNLTANHTLDARGLSCPMPIVRTKKTMGELAPGQVLEVQATDKGSTADMKAWAESTGNQYLGTVEREGVFHHYIRKSDAEGIGEVQHPHVRNHEQLQESLQKGENLQLIDVREPAEYAFGHIPGAKSIPLGELEERLSELHPDDEIHVICRTGSRSDLAAQKMAQKGFKHVWNVVPGMSEWQGTVQKQS